MYIDSDEKQLIADRPSLAKVPGCPTNSVPKTVVVLSIGDTWLTIGD